MAGERKKSVTTSNKVEVELVRAARIYSGKLIRGLADAIYQRLPRDLHDFVYGYLELEAPPFSSINSENDMLQPQRTDWTFERDFWTT